MKTHIIENGLVTNTISASVEEAQAAFPNAICIDADHGHIGWSYINGHLTPPKSEQVSNEQFNASILSALEVIDRKSIRALREGNSVRIAELESQASELRLQLKK